MTALAVLFPFLGAVLATLVGPRLGRGVGWIAVLSLLPALSLVLRAPQAAGGTVWREAWPWVPQIGLEVAFRLDGYSLLFALLIAVIGVLTSLYAIAYLYQENFSRFFSYLMLFAGAMLGLVLAENLVLLFGFWELTSITSFLLIGFWHHRGASRDGAVKALLVTGGGGLALLAAVAMIASAGGSANLSEIDLGALRASPLFTPALLLVLLAAFTKSAQLPFHLWLPTAMEAPTPVSAFLHSATMVKAGVFLIAKLGFLFMVPLWTTLTVTVGLATLFWSAYLALRQTDLKALLAYSTVSQLGLLVALYGLNDPAARFAATAHLINHAAFKAALFYVVGIIDHGAHTRELHQLGGLRRVMPVTFAVAVLGALSMAGLPPFGGFVSKELFFENMYHVGWLPALIAVVGSAFTLAYSLKLLTVFFGPLRAPKVAELHEAKPALWGPMIPLAALTVVFGLAPFTAEAVTRLAAPALGFTDVSDHLVLWHGIGPALVMSLLTWGLGALIFWQRGPIDVVQERIEQLGNVNMLYYASLRGLDRLAIRFTGASQGLTLPDQLRLTLTFIVGLVGYGLWRAGMVWPAQLSEVPMVFVPVALLLIAGAFGALFARDGISAIIFTGLTGFGTAAAFLAMRAPDLALTQLLIEAVTVILFLLVLRLLPPMRRFPRGQGKPVWDTLISAGVGTAVFAFVLASQRPLAERISPYFIENAYKEAGGKNVVNVILVDFRGFDTLGEIAVLAIVAVGVFALVRLKGRA
ncbi:hydrogen gas-evolving membrane-bound hydrogenase subunit E [Deinococcus peraridilitoris]|uniref:NADH:ubiquinone oxidoreductase subunit 5 (Chain L)/multisubunit Na+/H+ antiporter, MnhA subunit n=1 Tax=Deinococcus peraridilitoris (strain DSM 19664 / LMG 22246 / CIP 109416 / KR-200) TaxID=937777 RepID=K9ZYK2_DEIPD|nr:hydrogen gas-evolving membrane-bound hydrogenase subunit E [Deinococcus peraridilitoris]AFZ66651.1 NADH:ubiquinone oxidoreductase subunit 5 (chain L)/multisubunit Na+/H+ antiporter, MnhA subunit [Deinococcus peraridilitoris DSM 19664]